MTYPLLDDLTGRASLAMTGEIVALIFLIKYIGDFKLNFKKSIIILRIIHKYTIKSFKKFFISKNQMHTRPRKGVQHIIAQMLTPITKTFSELKEIKKGTRKQTRYLKCTENNRI